MAKNSKLLNHQSNSKWLRKTIHIGTNKAFGKWKLIWQDSNTSVHMVDISEKAAKLLMEYGMDSEG